MIALLNTAWMQDLLGAGLCVLFCIFVWIISEMVYNKVD